MTGLSQVREHLFVRTYFLDAYYRLVRDYEPIDCQLKLKDGIETYIRVVNLNRQQKTVIIANFLEDYAAFLEVAGITQLIEKMIARYDAIKTIYLPRKNLKGFKLIYGIWELENQTKRRIFSNTLDEIHKKRPDCKIRLFRRKTPGEELIKLYEKISAYQGQPEYNKYVIAIGIHKISLDGHPKQNDL